MEGVPGPVGDSLNLAVYPDPVFSSIRDEDQSQTREIMKLTPLEVPTSFLRQPQDGNFNSQSRINRPVMSKTQT